MANKDTRSKSSFASNVLKLTSSNVFAQGLGIVLAPILTRLFPPEAFGVAALFASITGIITVVACLRYELSIMLPKDDGEAANLLGVSAFFVLLNSAITAIILFFAADAIARIFNSNDLMNYLWLAPISVFIGGLFLIFNYWNSRSRHFGRISIVQVISSLVAQPTKLIFGFAGYLSGGVLIGATILGSLVSSSILGAQIWREDHRLLAANIRLKKMVNGIKRHKNFPLFDTWSALLNTFSSQLPTMLLGFFFSPAIVGFYALGATLVRLPINLIGRAIFQVFFQRASEANIKGNLDYVVDNVFKRLVRFGLLPLLVLTVTGQDLFDVAFGHRWAEAGFYVQLLSPWMFFSFVASPLSSLFEVLERQRLALFCNIILFTSRLLPMIIGGYMGNPRIALLLLSISGVLVYAWFAFLILDLSGVSWVTSFLFLLRQGFLCGLLILLILYIKSILASPIILLCLATLFVLTYELIYIVKDHKLRLEILPFFNRKLPDTEK